MVLSQKLDWRDGNPTLNSDTYKNLFKGGLGWKGNYLFINGRFTYRTRCQQGQIVMSGEEGESQHRPRLERDVTCRQDLNWRLYLQADSLAIEDLATALQQKSYRGHITPFYPQVYELHRAEGHVVVLVPKTARIQIRVHYLTPKAERKHVALVLAEEIGLVFAP